MSQVTLSFTPLLSPVVCHHDLCRMSNLRNAHVALSILGVKGHTGEKRVQLRQPERVRSMRTVPLNPPEKIYWLEYLNIWQRFAAC